MRQYLLIWLITALTLTSCGADTNEKKGDRFFALGEYFDAAAEYRTAYRRTQPKERADRGRRAIKMAEAYRHIRYADKALAAYESARRYHQADSLTDIRLGGLLLLKGDYKNALIHFQTAADSLGMLDMINAGIASARMGMKSREDRKSLTAEYTVKRMELFNSRRADYSPMLCGDEYDQLFFTSTRNQAKGDELSGITGTKPGDIFFSQKDEKGVWQRPQTIDTELNTELDEGACSFTPDSKTMYLTQCPVDASYPRFAAIVKANRSDASWGKAVTVDISSDTLSSFAHPAVSPDGGWLYFASDMPGGLGGIDIWRIAIGGQSMGGVENLGAPVNTPGNEMFPTFRPNGDLYFSSDGHPGLGGLDIFIATTDTASRGYTISHPGYPLNSQGDDFGMTFDGLRNSGFFSSNRGDAKGWDHIYSFEKHEVIQTVKGWVYERDGYELPAALVYMVGDNGTYLKLSVKGDGSFEEEIQPDVNYIFLGTCRGYLNHSEQLRVPKVSESEEYVLQFPLANITTPVLIDNIFYDFDKASLRPESEKALDDLVSLLNENPNVTIELSAHCDYRGSEKYNKRLSQQRAEACVAYLINKGIASDRLSPVGYGKDKPKIIKKRLTERYPFLHEGDTLTESFIKGLKNENVKIDTLSVNPQEACNQLNRRTEFIVLRTTYGLFDENGKLRMDALPKTETNASDSEENADDWF